MRVEECPRPAESPRNLAGAAGGLAVGMVSSLTGAAVEAVANYLTQTRAFKVSGSRALEIEESKKLLSEKQCLYVYLYTPSLRKYFLDNNIPTEKGKVLTSPFLTPEHLDAIEKKGVARFMAVLSFEPPNNLPLSSDKLETPPLADDKPNNTYFKTYVWKIIYPKFIDPGCPPLRNCNLRDVVMQLRLMYPTSPLPSETKNKATALSLGFQNVSAQTVANSASFQYSGWFAYNRQEPILSNIEFILVETSTPGELAKALAAALKANKEAFGALTTSPFQQP